MKKTPLRILCFALALCFAALSLSGCGRLFRPKYYQGYFENAMTDQYMSSQINLGVGENKKEFPKDGVDLQLYYALYKMDADNYDSENPVGRFRQEDSDTVLFGLYVHTDEGRTIINQYLKKSVDYTDIENYHFVKAISQEEAANKEYGYKTSFIMNMVRYHHSETIHIPEEFFNEPNGFFIIEIDAFRIPEGTEDCYLAKEYGSFGYCKIYYTMTDENTVELGLLD